MMRCLYIETSAKYLFAYCFLLVKVCCSICTINKCIISSQIFISHRSSAKENFTTCVIFLLLSIAFEFHLRIKALWYDLLFFQKLHLCVITPFICLAPWVTLCLPKLITKSNGDILLHGDFIVINKWLLSWIFIL